MRVPSLPVASLALLVLAPAAAAEPVRTLSVDPGRALSATVTLPPRGKVRLEAGTRTVKIKADGRDLAVAGRDLGRHRDKRTARLVVANDAGVTSVALGAGTLAQTASRTVRLRGVLTLGDRYGSSASDPLDRLAQRAGMLHAARPRTQSYLGQGVDGELHYRDRRNWAAAFLPGLLWRVAAERNSVLHARWAMEEVRDLAPVARFDDPDVGFVFWRAAALGQDLACTAPVPRLGLTPEDCALLQTLADEAGTRLVARSASNPLGLIPTSSDAAQCAQCLPGELRVIVDQLHNLPVLARSADPARRALALAHARWIASTLVRPDGATLQQGFIDQPTGALTRAGNFQGFDDTSVWSRGQAWAISGLARAATDLEDADLLAAAVRAADWWLAHAPAGALPPYDFSADPTAPRDSSALAIAGAGFAVLAARCGATAACDGVRYRAAAAAAAATLATRLEGGPQLGRLGEATYTAGGLTWDEGAELAWGSDFLAELLTL